MSIVIVADEWSNLDNIYEHALASEIVLSNYEWGSNNHNRHNNELAFICLQLQLLKDRRKNFPA